MDVASRQSSVHSQLARCPALNETPANLKIYLGFFKPVWKKAHKINVIVTGNSNTQLNDF